jgi:hypothetical protein
LQYRIMPDTCTRFGNKDSDWPSIIASFCVHPGSAAYAAEMLVDPTEEKNTCCLQMIHDLHTGPDRLAVESEDPSLLLSLRKLAKHVTRQDDVWYARISLSRQSRMTPLVTARTQTLQQGMLMLMPHSEPWIIYKTETRSYRPP